MKSAPDNTNDTAGEPPALESRVDAFGRKVDYLRISVTDRCDQRCSYCMPDGYKGWDGDQLTAGEIVRVVRAAAALGFRKFRLTGGEPLMRRDLIEIIGAMRAVPGVERIGLSTNGTKLAALARPLRAAGLGTVNVSLDALDSALYHHVTGSDVYRAIEGIRAAAAAGFQLVKLNCVLIRGVSESELWPLALFAAEHGLPLRFIELMPVTSAKALSEERFFPVAEAMQLLARHEELEPQPGLCLGWGPARYYRLKNTGAIIGFIGPVTTARFCDTCNRMRLSADGRLRPCLGNHGEIDARALLRGTAPVNAISDALLAALSHKPRRHAFLDMYTPRRPMTAIGG